MKLKDVPVNILSTDDIKSKKSVLKGFKALLKSFDFLFTSIDSPIIEVEEDFKEYDIETLRKIKHAIRTGALDKELIGEALYLYENLGTITRLVEIRDELRSTCRMLKHNINAQLSKIRCYRVGNDCIKFIKLIRCFYRYPTNDADAIGGVTPVIQTLTLNNYNWHHEKTSKGSINTGFTRNIKLF